MVEETGVAPKIGRLLYVQQYREDDGTELIEFFFHITNADDYETVNLAETSHGEIEVARNAFIDPNAETVLPTFLQDVDLNADMAEINDTRFFSYLSGEIDLVAIDKSFEKLYNILL